MLLLLYTGFIKVRTETPWGLTYRRGGRRGGLKTHNGRFWTPQYIVHYIMNFTKEEMKVRYCRTFSVQNFEHNLRCHMVVCKSFIFLHWLVGGRQAFNTIIICLVYFFFISVLDDHTLVYELSQINVYYKSNNHSKNLSKSNCVNFVLFLSEIYKIEF